MPIDLSDQYGDALIVPGTHPQLGSASEGGAAPIAAVAAVPEPAIGAPSGSNEPTPPASSNRGGLHPVQPRRAIRRPPPKAKAKNVSIGKGGGSTQGQPTPAHSALRPPVGRAKPAAQTAYEHRERVIAPAHSSTSLRPGVAAPGPQASHQHGEPSDYSAKGAGIHIDELTKPPKHRNDHSTGIDDLIRIEKVG
jgi:hypothetical protein